MTQYIGFDRKIKLTWLEATAWQTATAEDEQQVRDYLDRVLQKEGLSKRGRQNTLTVLLRVWNLVPPEQKSLQEQALNLLPSADSDERLWLHWGMSILAYPFFTDIASIIGRLLALQGNASLEQISRRVADKWGERSTVEWAGPRVIRSMVDWDALRDTAAKGVYVAGPKKPAREKIQLWFLEILLKSNLTTALPLDQLEHLACAFPLEITISAPAIYSSDTLGIERQGLDMGLVVVK